MLCGSARRTGCCARWWRRTAARRVRETPCRRTWRRRCGKRPHRSSRGARLEECLARWNVLSVEQVKGPWSQTEDDQLSELVSRYGGKQWARIATMMPGRTGKQCRERWCNNLDPTLKKGEWTHDEDLTILRLHKKLGTRWAEIAKSLPGRSDNGVKNRCSTCSRMLRQQVAEEEAAAEAAAGGGAAAPAPAAAAANRRRGRIAARTAAAPPRRLRGRRRPRDDAAGERARRCPHERHSADKARGDHGGADGGREPEQDARVRRRRVAAAPRPLVQPGRARERRRRRRAGG